MHQLFNSKSSNVEAATTKNAAGGKAYALDKQIALAKYCMTGVFNDTYNTSAEEQLDKVLDLCNNSEPAFVAKLAIHARKNGAMKDPPAVLLAWLAKYNLPLCKQVFSQVVDSPKMLRNFISVMRSGVINGKSKSLGTAPKKLVQNYLNSLSDEQLFRADVGNSPSLPDIIRMMHPKPASKEREALYAYLINKEPKKLDKDYLLPLAREFEAFKKDNTKELPNVPFQMLTALDLTTEQWCKIAERATFNQTRMNINTFERHGVFENPAMIDMVAEKLSNVDEIRRSRVMPYQLFTTFMNVNAHQKIKNALQVAVEVALENVPVIPGNIVICLDTSGSMNSPVTGNRGSVTTKTRYIDVAALFASAILRKNKQAELLPFDTEVHKIEINAHDSVMTNAQKLAAIRGGGTDVSAPIRELNNHKAKANTVIIISDNESWRSYAGKKYYGKGVKGTGLMHEWEEFSKRNKGAKLVNIDITPSDTSQTSDTQNVMLVGGLNDAVFDVVAGFLREDNNEYWLNTINEIKL